MEHPTNKPYAMKKHFLQALRGIGIGPTDSSSPWILLLAAIFLVVVSEVVTWLFLHRFRGPFDLYDAFVDAALTLLFIFPGLYLIFFRRISRQIKLLREMEKSLRQSEANYRGVIEDQTELICRFDGTGKITFANGAFCRFFDCTADAIQGEIFWSFFDPEDAVHLQQLVSGLSAHQPITAGEYRLQTVDGRNCWSAWTIHAIYRSPDEPAQYQSVGRDISDYKLVLEKLQESRDELELKVQQRTAEMANVNRELRAEIATRRSAESALRASDTHLRQLVNQIPAILWTMDQHLDLTSLLGSRLIEFQPQIEEILRTELHERLAANDLSRPEIQAHANALRGLSADFELRLADHDFQCTVEPFRDISGEIVGCLGIALDMTTHKRTEEIIQRQSAALQAAADGIIITDEKGVIRWCNPAMTVISGYSTSDLIGSTPAIFTSESNPKAFYQDLWNTILSGRVWHSETYNRRKDGSLYAEDQTITPVLDAKGKIQNFIAIKHDISDRKRYEDEITRRNQELQTLREASFTLAQSLEPEIVVQTMLDLVERLVPEAERIIFMTFEEDSFQAESVRSQGQRIALDTPILINADQYPRVQGILTTRASCLVEDTLTDPLWLPILDSLEVRSWLGVPILSGLNWIGICCLESSIPGCIKQEHIHLVEALLGHAAVSIQNARLYQEIRDGRARLRDLSHRLIDIQERERSSIARELHDDTSQALVGLVFALDGLKHDAGDPESVSRRVDELDVLISDILDNLHRLAVNLRPTALDRLGLPAALRQYADGLYRKYNLGVKLTIPDLPNRLPKDIETTLYRIIQEALANVVLHARATAAEVRIEVSPQRLCAQVVDNGIGFNLDEVLAQERLGLFGMRERAEMLGGSLAIDSVPGAGTRISLEVPLDVSDPDRG